MHVKGEAGASPFFVSVVSNSSPKPVVPALCSFNFCELLVAIHPIARGNHLHCSWQLVQLLVALRKSSLSFQKTSRTFLNSSLCFLKSWAGILKSWPTIQKSPPAIPKRQWLFPKTQAVLPAFPIMVNNA